MRFKNKIIFFAALLVLSQITQATEEITFTPDLLPTETIFPQLDSADMIRNRKLVHEKRFEFKADLLWVLDELFNDGKLWGVTAYYHVSNDLGYGFKYYSFPNAFNEYGKQFESKGAQIDLAPQPKSILAASLVNRLLYGKVSVSQNLVLPLTFEVQYDLGVNKYGASFLPFSSIGASHKLYFKKNFIFDISYFLQLHQVINRVSVNLRTGSIPNEDMFEKKIQISQALSLGIGYLF